MKKYTLSLLLVTFMMEIYAQDFRKNDCSDELKITFIGRGEAEWEAGNHVSARDYLNLILDEDGVLYKGKHIEDVFDLQNSLQRDSTLSNQFDVVIGIDDNAKFGLFSEVICWLGNLSRYRVDRIQAYHFD